MSREMVLKIRIIDAIYKEEECIIYFRVKTPQEEAHILWYNSNYDNYVNLMRKLDKHVWWIIYYNQQNYISQFKISLVRKPSKFFCILQ